MNKPINLNEILQNHQYFCKCEPIWIEGKHGQELKCAKEDVWLWWPIPELTDLTDVQRMSLSIGLPMMYDTDGDDIYTMLMDGGYNQINATNFSEAYKYCVSQLEKALWEDNVGKQLLGRIFNNDLQGEL